MVEALRGDSRKIKAITPKFAIKDDGTDYTDGEEYNGLLAGGSLSAPTGYGGIGHWKFLEEQGRIAFNNRVRGSNDLIVDGCTRSADAVGNYLGFRLLNNEPLISANPNYFIMIGTGGSYTEIDEFNNFLNTPGFENVLGDRPDNEASMRYMFDIWGYFRTPQANDKRQTLFYLHDEGGGSGTDKILIFCIRNNGGTLVLSLYYVNAGHTVLASVESSDAGNAIFPGGVGVDGGLHHVSFILDATVLNGSSKIKFSEDSIGPEGLYVDGKYYQRTGGNTTNWDTTQPLTSLTTNAFIGCEIHGQDPVFTAPKGVGEPRFTNHFTGKIYQASLTKIGTAGELTLARMATLHVLKFNIPRGPSKVDFSERFEYNGKNLLQEIGIIKQALESDKGSAYVTVQSVKVRN